MNWHRKLIFKIAAAKNKINALKVVDPSLKFFIYKYEEVLGDDWQKIKSPQDLQTYISQNLIPTLQEKINPTSEKSNYMKSKHVDIPKEYALNPDDPIMQQAHRAYQTSPDTAIKALLEHLNYDKKHSFEEWWEYLTTEDLYKSNPAFQYSILKPMIDSSPETQKDGPPPLNSEALGAIWEEINENNVTQMNILKKYRKVSSKLDKEGVQSVEAGKGTEWIRIPSQKSEPENFEENVKKLRRYAQGTGWCIARKGTSDNYLSQGDFWFYLVDGRATVAIRLVDNKVREIRGHRNQQSNLDPYWQEVMQFLATTSYDYKDNKQYKELEDIYLMNANLERGTNDYNIVMDKIKKDHKVYLKLSQANREKFPEFLDIAKNGYRMEIEDHLQKMEAPGLKEGKYFYLFEDFQSFYNNIPPEMKQALGDMQPRILEAHKRAFRNNPYLYPEFPDEIKQQISPEDQMQAWRGYVQDDPYHYNDNRMPKEIKQSLQLNLKEIWLNMLSKNTEHFDYMPKKIIDLFQPGEIEKYILDDFASFPVSYIFGRYDKLKRVEDLVRRGFINRQQIVDIFKNSIAQHPEWIDRIPKQYKTEVLGGKKVTEVGNIVREKAMHVMRDPGYFKTMPADMQDAILKQYGTDIGKAFETIEAPKYRGLLSNFWASVPENVRQYLPDNIKDQTAQFYANMLAKEPSNFDNLFRGVPPDLQGLVWSKLASVRNWYKRSQKISLYDELTGLKNNMAKAAQNAYNEWEQDESGQDEIFGGGGICDDISMKLAEVIADNILNVNLTEGGQQGDEHMWLIAHRDNEVYGVDIPPSIYEIGGGYVWDKIPDVIFSPEHINIWKIEINANELV